MHFFMAAPPATLFSVAIFFSSPSRFLGKPQSEKGCDLGCGQSGGGDTSIQLGGGFFLEPPYSHRSSVPSSSKNSPQNLHTGTILRQSGGELGAAASVQSCHLHQGKMKASVPPFPPLNAPLTPSTINGGNPTCEACSTAGVGP